MTCFFILRIGGSGLHHCRRQAGIGGTGAVGAENVGAGVLAAEDGALRKQGQTADSRRTAGADGGVGDDFIIEGQVDGVVIPVEGHGGDVDGGVDQLRGADLGRGGGVQHRLGFPGQVDPEVLDAVLIPAGIGDLLGMDGQGAAQVLGPAFKGVVAVFTHGNTS